MIELNQFLEDNSFPHKVRENLRNRYARVTALMETKNLQALDTQDKSFNGYLNRARDFLLPKVSIVQEAIVKCGGFGQSTRDPSQESPMFVGSV